MIKFSEMPYQRPDVEGMKETLKNAAEKAVQAKTYQEVRDAYFEVQEKSIQASTLYSIAHVRNTMDTTDEYYDGELKWLREQLAMLTPLEVAWQKALTMFYQQFGWDEKLGCPTRASLEKFDLKDVADELESKGLLPA